MDLVGQVDVSTLFEEINRVFKKYGVGRGVGFVPDQLEVKMDRAASGACKLVYREFFTYLPPDVMELAMTNAVEFLSSLGVPKERIKPLEAGVEVTLEGDAKIAYFPMLEMLIQDRGIAGSIYSALDGLKGSIHNLMDLFDFAWDWDSASEEIWRSNIEKLSAVIEANPGMQGEIEDIVKKYSSKKGVV